MSAAGAVLAVSLARCCGQCLVCAHTTSAATQRTTHACSARPPLPLPRCPALVPCAAGQETLIDYHKVKADVKEGAEKAKARAKEDTKKVAAAAKEASE